MRIIFCCLLSVCCLSYAAERDNGVVLLYHHVSESTPPSTSISPSMFRRHMQLLAQEYQVVPLSHMVNQLKAGKRLPDKTVSISFDDGYANIFDNAHPILQEHKFPYTVFVNPDQIGSGSLQLSWQQIKQMDKQGAEFANHTNSHQHLLAKDPGESESQWLARVMQDIEGAEQQLHEQLGYSLKLFAYPYGEFNRALKQLVRKAGYIGFGQQSGAIASYSDFAALPRYPAAGIYANPNTLKVKLSSLALPIDRSDYHEPQLAFQQQPKDIHFTPVVSDYRPKQIACYWQGEAIDSQWRDPQVVILMSEEIGPGRSRINCTAPSTSAQGRFYWYSIPYFMPNQQGIWLD